MTYLLNYHIDWLLGCKPITRTDALRRGSLSYLNHKALTDKDDGLSLGSQEEFQIAICLVFEEMQKMIFEDVLIFFWHMTFFTGPTDDSGRYPTKNSKGCESFDPWDTNLLNKAQKLWDKVFPNDHYKLTP